MVGHTQVLLSSVAFPVSLVKHFLIRRSAVTSIFELPIERPISQAYSTSRTYLYILLMLYTNLGEMRC